MSPDTGTTTDTYDSAGNLATSTDARGALATYGYDALNRVTSIAYSLGGTTDQTLSFTYDQGTDGVGHLTGASDANHSMSFGYDALGEMTGTSQTVGGVTRSASYGYTNGDLTTLTSPSGQTVTYVYNANHQVSSIAVNGTTILSNVSYEPFGPADGWTWGNGSAFTRTFDGDGDITGISTIGSQESLSYDSASRISGFTNTASGASNWTYGYDPLDRLNSATSSSVNEGWTYDADGNRLSETGTSPSTYSISSTSNEISGITGTLTRTYAYDAAGNTQSDSTDTDAYNDAGRLKTVTNTSGTTTFVYNALGQMIEASGPPGATLYVYDHAGHLLGEYDGSGNLIQETVWLGDIPVATIQPSGSSVAVYYVETDQLNTPRAVIRPSDNALMWSWFTGPFGVEAPNTNPQGAGTFTYDLRFPGQIAGAWGSTYQNYMRDYDPAVGRYDESDPIGLKGGINTYAYAADDPVVFYDPSGEMCVYSQLTGNLTCVNDITGQVYIDCNGYSGQGRGYNNPLLNSLSGSLPRGLQAFEHNIDAGPLPRGYYMVGTAITRHHFAPPVYPLWPLPFTNMWGRSGMEIHGDSGSHPGRASNGCMIMSHKCRAEILPGETLQVTW